MASFSFPPAWPRSGYTRECRITERGDRNVRFAEGRDHIHGLVPSHVKNHQQTNSPQYQPTRQIHRKIQDICMYLLDRYDLVDMENAPMTLAHTHARNAVLETRRSNPVAASEEHDLAAAEFANAAQTTNDAEALRILRLLEQHHKQLGQILKFRHEHPQSYDKPESLENAQDAGPSRKATISNVVEISKPVTSPDALQHLPRLAGGRRTTARDLSSSIVSNLASARGIPGGQRRGIPVSPTISAQHVPGSFGKDQAKTKRINPTSRPSKPHSGFFSSNDPSNDGKPSWAPPTHVANDELPTPSTTTVESAASMNDAPFQQFYNTFESLVSKLSAPLAFASLPLVSSPTTTPKADTPIKSKDPPPPASEAQPDYSQLISRAALRAVQGGPPAAFNPAESFYVVPATGLTISYADIMSRADREGSGLRHHRHLSNLSEDTTDDFVDARETLPAASKSQDADHPQPRLPPRLRNLHPPSSPTINGRSLEELVLHNAAQKQTIDAMSKRLHDWEGSAQTSAAALAYSIRSITRSNPPTPETSQGKTANTDRKASARIAELEEILKKNDKELIRRDKENAKLKETIGKYREKWEKLKEGARARRGGDPAERGVDLGKAREGSLGTISTEQVV